MSVKVLQLIGSFSQGGSERQCIQLARILQQSGRCEVHMATLDPSGVLRAEVEALGLPPIPSFPLTSFYDGNFARQLRRFGDYLTRNDITIVQSSDFYTNIFGMFGAALAGTPVRIAARRESAKRPRAQRFVERLSFRAAQAVVANCDEVRQQLIREGVPAKKVVTIYNGLETGRIQSAARKGRAEMLAQLGLPPLEGEQVVSIVANLRSPVKNIPLFLAAASQVRTVAPKTAFLIAGEGELMEPLKEEAARLSLGDSVYFLGRCQAVAELLAISDICVLSSTSEGFSNAILEYLAAGRPAVVTDVGGAREAVIDDETGYVVPSGDAGAMAKRIIELLRRPERRRQMGENGRRLVAARFSVEARLHETLRLYDRLLRGSAVSVTIPPLEVEDVPGA